MILDIIAGWQASGWVVGCGLVCFALLWFSVNDVL
jgi:hypothetical protein